MEDIARRIRDRRRRRNRGRQRDAAVGYDQAARRHHEGAARQGVGRDGAVGIRPIGFGCEGNCPAAG